MGRILKVAVLMKSERDEDHLCSLVRQVRGIVICESISEADVIVYDVKLLTKSEKEALKAVGEFWSINEAAEKIFKSKSTLKKQLLSAREKRFASCGRQLFEI